MAALGLTVRPARPSVSRQQRRESSRRTPNSDYSRTYYFRTLLKTLLLRCSQRFLNRMRKFDSCRGITSHCRHNRQACLRSSGLSALCDGRRNRRSDDRRISAADGFATHLASASLARARRSDTRAARRRIGALPDEPLDRRGVPSRDPRLAGQPLRSVRRTALRAPWNRYRRARVKLTSSGQASTAARTTVKTAPIISLIKAMFLQTSMRWPHPMRWPLPTALPLSLAAHPRRP